MRKVRKWYFNEFSPKSAKDILRLYKAGESESAKYRMVVSYWDMAASFVINSEIAEKSFLGANTEHIFVFTKIEPYLCDVREMFGEDEYLLNLEELCKTMPDFDLKLETRRRLAGLWAKE